MKSDWEITTLGNVLTLQRGMDLPTQDRKIGKHPIVASTGVVGYHESAPVKGPGVVIGRSGSIGGGQYIEQDFWPLNTTLWVKDFKGNNPRYCYYLLKSIDFSSMNAGSGVPTLNRNHLHPMQVKKASLSIQNEIVGILASLDDGILLLREINLTLEEVSQNLFKSWFVNFEPVHKKKNGGLLEGIDYEVASLFANSFEESELGEIPKGWVVQRVSNIAEIIKGKSYSSKDLVENSSTALVTLKSFERGGGFRMDGFKPYSGNFKTTQVVIAGDLIVAYTDVTQAAELIGKPAIVVAVEEYETLVASLDVGIVRPDNNNCGSQFLYGLFKTDLFRNHTLSHTSGTTVLHLAKDAIGSFQFPLPPINLVNKFETIAGEIAKRKQINSDKIRTLTKLRDTLLPRLISGQILLPDVEKQIETETT